MCQCFKYMHILLPKRTTLPSRLFDYLSYLATELQGLKYNTVVIDHRFAVRLLGTVKAEECKACLCVSNSHFSLESKISCLTISLCFCS